MNVWSQFSDTQQNWSFICYNIIYQGEGIERGGQHIHTFIPDDVRNFNASHIIHDLRFGPDYSNGREQTTLKGVTKIVTEENGEYVMSQCWMLCYCLKFDLLVHNVFSSYTIITSGISGMFQYFIKIVPTTYKGKKVVKSIAPKYDFRKDGNKIPQLETNRYFTTERFTPLMLDIDDENWDLGEMVAERYKQHTDKLKKAGHPVKEKEDENKPYKDDYHDYDDYYDFYYERQEAPALTTPEKFAGAKVGGNAGTSHHEHENHRKQQGILPGVFFIYQVYPFAVEISKEEVPLTHLFIRILSTIGGMFTIMGMIDNFLSSRSKGRGIK